MSQHPRLWIPGPVEVDEEILQTLATPLIGHRGAEFKSLYESCQPGLKKIFGTERPVFVATASATGIMEACMRNLVRKKSLHLVCGAFSDRWFEIAKECGREPIKIEVEWGKALKAPMLAEALEKNPDVECVFLTHSETSTGDRTCSSAWTRSARSRRVRSTSTSTASTSSSRGRRRVSASPRVSRSSP